MSKQVEKSKDKCQGCNNVKGCITCVDGSEWAHVEEAESDIKAYQDRWGKSNGYIEEPESKDRIAFKALPRLLEMIEPNDRAKAYTSKLAEALEKEGYITDAKIVRENIKMMNGEKVAMATMDEEPVSGELEEEINSWFSSHLIIGNLAHEENIAEVRSLRGFGKSIARHFSEWQKKQTINKACEWLDDNLLHYWGQLNANDTEEFIKELRKYLED